MSIQFDLPKWYDLHVHLRQDDLLKVTIRDHLRAQCAGVLAMPNTKPPVGKILKSDPLPYWSIEEYLKMILVNGGDEFKHIIIPLYLTNATTPLMIEKGAKNGLLQACKYYPPHGTTNSDHGSPFSGFDKNGVFKSMEEHNIILCIHGEQTGLSSEQYFARETNAEEKFYHEDLPELHLKYPNLKIVCEHVTTKVAVDFVKSSSDMVSATITPQHLMYTVGHLLQGLKYHLYCLPLLKFEEDRAALRNAVTDIGNIKFFAGTDSAPHTLKATDCGCAAGCYTAPIAPQLYAKAFEEAGVDLSLPRSQKIFKNFLCDIGPKFYNLPMSNETFTLVKKTQLIDFINVGSEFITPLPVGLNPDHANNQTKLDWAIIENDTEN